MDAWHSNHFIQVFNEETGKFDKDKLQTNMVMDKDSK